MSSREVHPIIDKKYVYEHAMEIFGEPKKTFSWMNTPNPVLSGMCPKDFIDYAPNKELKLIVDELDRIDQGLF